MPLIATVERPIAGKRSGSSSIGSGSTIRPWRVLRSVSDGQACGIDGYGGARAKVPSRRSESSLSHRPAPVPVRRASEPASSACSRGVTKGLSTAPFVYVVRCVSNLSLHQRPVWRAGRPVQPRNGRSGGSTHSSTPATSFRMDRISPATLRRRWIASAEYRPCLWAF